MFQSNKFFKMSIMCHLLLLQMSVALSRRTPRNILELNSVPYLVKIFERTASLKGFDGPPTLLCSGTLVAPKFVVTAAHCVENWDPSEIQAVGGSSVHGGQCVHAKVINIKIHASYNNVTLDNDVAVLELGNTLSSAKGTYIEKIKLCNEEWKSDDAMQVSSWGQGKEKYLTNKLRAQNVKVLDKEQCKEIHQGKVNITDSKFCAAADVPEALSCYNGGEGGPVVFNGKLCGIVSWSKGSASPNSPDVYTSVLKVRSFIEDAIKSEPPRHFVTPTYMRHYNERKRRAVNPHTYYNYPRQKRTIPAFPGE